MTTTRVAAIDCGTNTIRLLVADIGAGAKADLVREMRIVRLGQGVDVSGRLSDEAIERTIAACREYADIIEPLDVDLVTFCATSAARDADNAELFAARVEHVLGVRPVVLTGQQEAAASFDGATRELPSAGRTAVIDLGGGSTEVVIGEGSTIGWSHSFNLGSVRMTERFLAGDPPDAIQIGACTDELDHQLGPVLSALEESARVLGVAGTITTIAAYVLDTEDFDPAALHGASLPVDRVREGCVQLAAMSVQQRRALPFMHPGRADVIGAGALILDRVLAFLPMSTCLLQVSTHDILDGIAWAAAGTTG